MPDSREINLLTPLSGSSRRDFLKVSGAAGLLAFLGACGIGNNSGGSKAKSLNIYNWTDYVAADTIPGFEKLNDIKITYDTYASNDELFNKIRAGATGYDLIVPTDSTISRMIEAELLDELNHDNIPNLENLAKKFREASFDPGNKYSVAYQYGTTGIGYNSDELDGVKDWDIFLDKRAKNRCSLVDEAREAYAAAAFALGHNINSVDNDDLDAADEWLKEVKANLRSFTADYQDPLRSGDLILAHAYSGDIFQIQPDNENIEYVVPKSGAVIWVDCMCIPKGAKNKANAEAFINYILDPQVGADLTNFVAYGTPNTAALELVDEEIVSDPVITLSEDEQEKFPFVKYLGADEQKILDRFEKLKNS